MTVVNRHKGEKRSHSVREPSSRGSVTNHVAGRRGRGTCCHSDVIWRPGCLESPSEEDRQVHF